MERAEALLESLERWLPIEATWLALSDPRSTVYATVEGSCPERSVLDHVDCPATADQSQPAELHRQRPSMSSDEPAFAAEELPAWAERLPDGSLKGLGMPLLEPGGPYLGMLTLLFTGAERPSAALREGLAKLAPLIARGVSPMPSLLATAQLVHGARFGAVMRDDGAVYPVPGLGGHPLLVSDSRVARIARQTLLTGQVYRSFVWRREMAKVPPATCG
ncbi:hypothetical protein Q9R29_04065 [Rothia sp. ARF10]|nr:hypothetical protein [Rothia sp. ARF10]